MLLVQETILENFFSSSNRGCRSSSIRRIRAILADGKNFARHILEPGDVRTISGHESQNRTSYLLLYCNYSTCRSLPRTPYLEMCCTYTWRRWQRIQTVSIHKLSRRPTHSQILCSGHFSSSKHHGWKSCPS